MKKIDKLKTAYVISIAVAVLAMGMILSRCSANRNVDPLDYSKSLDKQAVEINGTKLTLRDMAFYVAYEEAKVEENALMYDREHPVKLWNANLKKNGYTRIAARNAAMKMAIHDQLFYEMAQKEKIELTAEDEKRLKCKTEDFLSDIGEYSGLERMGVTKEEISREMRKSAYAQKYQKIFAELHNKKYEDYDCNAKVYKKFLKKQKYKVNKSVWERIKFGSITLGH